MTIARMSLVLTLLIPAIGVSQAPPSTMPARPRGPVSSVSPPIFGSPTMRPLGNGRYVVHGSALTVNDSAFAPLVTIHRSSPLEPTEASGALLAYVADSTVFVRSRSSLTYGTVQEVEVIDPSGKVVRTFAWPPHVPNMSTGLELGGARLDPNERIVFRAAPVRGAPRADSMFVLAYTIATGRVDTLGALRWWRHAESALFASEDRWTSLPDGSVAIVRAKDYHIDWIAPNGTRTSSPPMPYPSARLTDADKQRLADSASARRDSLYAGLIPGYRMLCDATGRVFGSTTPGVRIIPLPPGTSSTPVPRALPNAATPSCPKQPAIPGTSVPDFLPPLAPYFAVLADADGRVWIKVNPQPAPNQGFVYDIADRNGRLIDRVQLPPGRVVMDFAPGGIVYLAVAVSEREVRLEKVRFR
jgi:hypothetical protein